jgi:hypothetical protein
MTGLPRNPPMTVGMAGYAEFIIGRIRATRWLTRHTQHHSAASSAPASITSSTFGGDIGKL